MKILVTGAGGQLGREIRDLSDNYPYQFIFTDISDLDITNLALVKQNVLENKVSCVINCAAYTAVDVAESKPDIATIVNVDAVRNLVLVSNEFDIPLIHISTDYVFDGEKSTPYNETDKPNPLSVYGKTKLEGEQEILKNAFRAIIFRTSWLYSNYGNNFVKTIIRLGKERDRLKLVYDQIGTPTYAKDMAEFILNNIQFISQHEKPDIYHYSNEGVASWYDFAKAIIELAKIDCTIEPIETYEYPTPARRPCYSVLSKKKVKQIFRANISYWRDSLRNCLIQPEKEII